MNCPVCGQLRYRGKGSNKMWSDAQWTRENARVDDLHMNCCKLCADHVGTYFTKATHKTPNDGSSWGGSATPSRPRSRSPTPPGSASASSSDPPPSPPTPPSCSSSASASSTDPPPRPPFEKQELQNDWQVSARWLRANVPTRFWELFKNHLVDANIRHREELKEINRNLKLSEKTSLLKHMSYYGAIEIPDAVPDGSARVDFTMVEVDGTRRNFIDPGNRCYIIVFRQLWPAGLPFITDPETLGDCVEAFLGYHWTLTNERLFTFSDIIEDIVQMLTKAVFSFWALDVYFPEWRHAS